MTDEEIEQLALQFLAEYDLDLQQAVAFAREIEKRAREQFTRGDGHKAWWSRPDAAGIDARSERVDE